MDHFKHARAIAILTSAAFAAINASAFAGQQFSFESPTDIDTTVLPPGTSEGTNWVWGNSYDSQSSRIAHSQSTSGVTDGGFSMKLSQPLSTYLTDTQVNMSPDDGAGGPHTLAFANYAASTKLLIDVTTPGDGPGYQTMDVALNFGGGNGGGYHYVTAYSGNSYQFVDGNPGGATPRTTPSTQTYTWDFGTEMQENLGAVLPDLGNYTIIHLSTGNGGAAAGDPNSTATSQYFLDNIHFLNEDTSTRSTYQTIGAGSWTDASKWAHGVPNAVGAPAIFNGTGAGTGTVAANTTVTLNSGVTVGSIIFDSLVTNYDYIGASGAITSANALPQIVNYTVAGTGSLTISSGTGSLSEIYTIAGAHNINVPVSVANDLSIDTSAGFTADNNSGLPGGGRYSNVSKTSLTFGAPLTMAVGSTLTTRGAGTVTFAAIRGGGSLVINGGYAGISAKATANSSTGTSKVSSLTIAPSAKFDLSNNSMVIDYTGVSPITSVRTALRSGNIVTSSAAATPNTGIGYGEASTVLGASGGTFAGQTADNTSVLLKFTYLGDANLDGKVNIADLGLLATNYGLSAAWTGGDFNYDGTVNIADLGLLATSYGSGATTPLALSFTQALSEVGLGNAVVPEPTTLAGLAGLGLLVQRRRRK